MAHEQRQKLTGIEAELAAVQRRLDRVWQVIETSDLELADATARIKAHRARQERLERAADETRARLSAAGRCWITCRPLRPLPKTCATI